LSPDTFIEDGSDSDTSDPEVFTHPTTDYDDIDDFTHPTTDYDDIDVEWDLAITHKRNEELRERDAVKNFFDRIKKVTSLSDPEALRWLSSLRHVLRREPIPLFQNNMDGSSEDYQLHPNYSWLRLGECVTDPDIDFYQMSSVDGDKVQNHRMFMPLGRLFVNAPNGDRLNKRCSSRRPRLTRWTGYEVFVSEDLSLWIVFDAQSLARGAQPWYPVHCGITEHIKKHTAIPMSFVPGIACLFLSLRELEHVTFEIVKNSVTDTFRSGKMRLDEVEKSEAIRRVTQTAPIPAEKGNKDADEIARAEEGALRQCGR